VLVHPESGDEVADHTAHALWLGNRLPLRLDALQAH
jgi:DOPA 4,5-dioxygenase